MTKTKTIQSLQNSLYVKLSSFQDTKAPTIQASQTLKFLRTLISTKPLLPHNVTFLTPVSHIGHVLNSSSRSVSTNKKRCHLPRKTKKGRTPRSLRANQLHLPPKTNDYFITDPAVGEDEVPDLPNLKRSESRSS
jgi:hypothetical protein